MNFQIAKISHQMKTRSSSSSTGFTLMELMVVVAILGVLIALVLPAANGLQSASQAAVEQSAARGLVGAWRSWSMDHQGQLIPGQTAMDTPLSPSEAPVMWNNTPIPEIARRRWIWRLLPWMDSPEDSLWVGDQASFWENTIANAPDPAEGVYLTTLHPSFGLNTDFLGGRQTPASDTWALSQYVQSTDEGARPFYSDSLARIRKPANLIAFASSRGPVDGGSGRILEGYWRLEPPWKPAAGGSAPRWATENGTFVAPDPQTDPATVGGYLSPRHNDRIVVAAPDGHVSMEPFEALGSMQRWADGATGPHWAPSLP